MSSEDCGVDRKGGGVKVMLFGCGVDMQAKSEFLEEALGSAISPAVALIRQAHIRDD